MQKTEQIINKIYIVIKSIPEKYKCLNTYAKALMQKPVIRIVVEAMHRGILKISKASFDFVK